MTIYQTKNLIRPYHRRDTYHFQEETTWTKENTSSYNTLKLKQDICTFINQIYDPTNPIKMPFKLTIHENGFCKKKAKELISYIYKGGQCRKCHNPLQSALEFHHKYVQIYDHIDDKIILARIKTKEIGRFSRANVPDKTLWALLRELDVIEQLCGNCHGEIDEEKTNEIKDYLLKLGLEENKQQNCQKCGLLPKSISQLEFHHRDPHYKDFPISDICWMSDNKQEFKLKKDSRLTKIGKTAPLTINQVLAEMDKCDIICPNCHNTAHTNLDKFHRLLIPIAKKAVEWIEKQEKSLDAPTKQKTITQNTSTTRYDNPQKIKYIPNENYLFGVEIARVKEIRKLNKEIQQPDRRSITEREKEKRKKIIQERTKNQYK